MAARWHKDIDQIPLILSFFGSIRPCARPMLYRPFWAALCALVGILIAATSGSLPVAIIGFLFIPRNNWLAGLLFSLLAAAGGWLQLAACTWGFIHIALDAIESKGPSLADRILLRVRAQYAHHPPGLPIPPSEHRHP